MPLPGDENVPLAQIVIFDVEQQKKIEVQTEPVQIVLSGPIELRHLWWGEDGTKLFRSVTAWLSGASGGAQRPVSPGEGT